MCGIAGFAGFSDPELLRRMTSLISYRGPDDDGFYEESSIGLGHRRLSIIDVSGGHQPMHSADGRFVIVYNGEVYNHNDLRAELEARGVKFETHCDTEVLVNAYMAEGPGFVSKLNGIFAFAIWDTRTNELFLARDQMGIKPLLYLERDGVLLFASEAKALMLWPEYQPKLNPEALRENMVFSYVCGDETMLAGIKKLPPGCTLTWRAGRSTIRPYWTLDTEPEPDRGEEYYTNGVVDLLSDSVRGQLMSDVPLGATLSGGLDSSSIVALMARHAGRAVKTFTVGFGGSKDELEYARIVADTFKTDHQEFIVDPSRFTEMLPRVVWHLEEPVLSSIMPTWYLGEAARKLVTVILIGEGSDEIFAGYRRLWPVSSRYRRFVPSGIKKHWYFWHLGSMGGPGNEEIFAPSLRRELSDPNPVNRYYYPAMAAKADALNGLLLHEQRYELADFQLLRIDRLTMAHSVEARVPFLDPRLVQFTNKMPSHYKLRGNTEKYILKRAMQRILPAQTLERRKQGLGTPLVPWFKNGLYDVAADLLSPANLKARGLFEPYAVERLFHTSRNTLLHREDLGKLFKLLMVEIWHRMFIDQKVQEYSKIENVMAGSGV
jgi:asparagine synthase (glutamine-hydrolysing)